MKAVHQFLLFLLIFSSFELSAQKNDSTEVVYIIVEKMPQPEGGLPAIHKWFLENLDYNRFDRIDTLDCNSNNSKIFVSFFIDETGQLIEPRVMKGISKPYDEYCLELISQIPIKWTPGTDRGKPVKVKSVLPFQLCQHKELTEQPEKKKLRKR